MVILLDITSGAPLVVTHNKRKKISEVLKKTPGSDVRSDCVHACSAWGIRKGGHL